MGTETDELIICENGAGTWGYHLRVIKANDGPKRGGLPVGTEALCGYDHLGWDTRIRVEVWGSNGHSHPVSWCEECETRARRMGFRVGREARE